MSEHLKESYKIWGPLAEPVFPSDTMALAFWRSLGSYIPDLQPTNIPQLASEIRRSWNEYLGYAATY